MSSAGAPRERGAVLSRRTTARTIPGGIVDTQGERVFVRDRGGRVLALDAAAGRVLWRSENAFLPLLALSDKLIGARITGPNSFEAVIVAPADGREICSSRAVSLPDWTRLTGEHADFELKAEEDDGRILIRWAVRARYRGGAPPSARVLQAATKFAAGIVDVDAETAKVLHETTLPEAPTSADEDVAGAASAEAIEPAAGARTFELVTRDVTTTKSQLLLRAADDKGHSVWETVIDEGSPQRPKPLRR